MLQGFGTWQLRIAGAGCVGAVAAVVGAALRDPLVLTLGVSASLMSLMALVLSSARLQNRRTQQIKSSLARLEVKSKSTNIALSVPTPHLGTASDAHVAQVGSEFEYAARMISMQPHFETLPSARGAGSSVIPSREPQRMGAWDMQI